MAKRRKVRRWWFGKGLVIHGGLRAPVPDGWYGREVHVQIYWPPKPKPAKGEGKGGA